MYFTQNEKEDKDTVYKVVFTYLKNVAMSELELLPDVINDTTNEFSLVIAAKKGNHIFLELFRTSYCSAFFQKREDWDSKLWRAFF